MYDVTLAIRSLIAARCETTLSWDQLRSPQISQFLVKPIQQRIMASHFSRASLYALMTNCLQFSKEVHLYPGNSGTSQTRAMLSELLAIKLLRDYTTRELIDALSYEFYPLQSQTPGASVDMLTTRGRSSSNKQPAGAARISCMEIAIRGQAKRFLAHPVVVQQLEAIWAGTIVFHSAADSLHRPPATGRLERLSPNYGTSGHVNSDIPEVRSVPVRRSVTLYDPRDASLFKLSRLRVPRYRQFLSTVSFAVLLGLFLAVLAQRRVEITSLEILFWLWSAGFMLDEVVGFNEQGFSLYLMSFWNVFDLGILLLLCCYYCIRFYGALVSSQREAVADPAYDILAANAVLLFPRLFSVLDHYRYFSQLLIAFRIMAADLVAVFVLIIIVCSGFLVAFTFSFGHHNSQSAGSIAYALFQMLMGFSPAAWTLWEDYNALGKAILTVFLFICHFVVITILITVLTNSFMRIVQNAYQEHQFLFAVNTISMVKSDALFSYVAPTNLLAWMITPLRYLMPFRQFVKINRTIIKITHLPILFSICLYEKAILGSRVVEATDLVEPPIETPAPVRRPRYSRFRTFSSKVPRLVREPSIATHQKDRALDEVFQRLFKDETAKRPANANQGQKTTNIVKDWMQSMGPGPISPPDEQDPKELDRLERQPKKLRFPFHRRLHGDFHDFTETTRSVASNPEERYQQKLPLGLSRRGGDTFLSPGRTRHLSPHTDIEGDDELTSDESKNSANDKASVARNSGSDASRKTVEETPHQSTASKFYASRPSTAKRVSRRNSPTRRPKMQSRTMSGATVRYRSNQGDAPAVPVRHRAETPMQSGAAMSTSADQSVMGHGIDATLSRSNPGPVPDLGGSSAPDSRPRGRRQSSFMFDLGSDLGDNKEIANGFVGAVTPSFTTEMAYATGIRRPSSPDPHQDRLSKLVLARMNNIEEGFREVIKEVKDLRRGESSRSQSQLDDIQGTARDQKRNLEKKEGKKRSQGSRRTKTSTDNSALSDGSHE